jgi:hypothetical protein
MRRAAGTVLAMVLVALAAGWWGATPAYACSCARAPLATYFANADAVFVGRLVSRTVTHPAEPMRSSADPALHVFAVDAVYKGDVLATQGVVSADAGASCGLELQGNGPFIVFGSRDDFVDVRPGPGQFAASLCDGTTAVTPALRAQVATLGGGTPGTPLPVPTTATPPEPGQTEAGSANNLQRDGAAVLAGGLALLVGLTLRRSRNRRSPGRAS